MHEKEEIKKCRNAMKRKLWERMPVTTRLRKGRQKDMRGGGGERTEDNQPSE